MKVVQITRKMRWRKTTIKNFWLAIGVAGSSASFNLTAAMANKVTYEPDAGFQSTLQAFMDHQDEPIVSSRTWDFSTENPACSFGLCANAAGPKELEALGFTHVESNLPPIVRDWCVGDEVLCLIEGEFEYSDLDTWKKLKPYPLERVLTGYTIFAGLVVVADTA